MSKLKVFAFTALSLFFVSAFIFMSGNDKGVNVRYVKIFDQAYAYQTTPVKNGGVIEGLVLFKGSKKPKNKKMPIIKDQEVCGEGYKVDPVYIISKRGGVKNAVVYIENIKGGKPLPKKEVELIQEKCEFKPRITVTGVGTTLAVINKDDVTHEANGVLNFILVFLFKQHKKGDVDRVTFKGTGLVEITCNIHSWMRAWIMVLDNPYYSVTDSEGRFKITDIPPGKYRIKMWHEGFGEMVKEVEVKPGKVTKLNFEIKG